MNLNGKKTEKNLSNDIMVRYHIIKNFRKDLFYEIDEGYMS